MAKLSKDFKESIKKLSETEKEKIIFKFATKHQAIYEQIKQRTDSGLGNIADLSQVTGRLARAQSNMISARNNNLDARSQFIRLTNTQPENLIVPVPDADMLPETKDSGLDLAIKTHPVIRSAQQDIRAARSFKSAVRANYYPTLSLELAANSDNDIGGESGINRLGPNVGGHRNAARPASGAMRKPQFVVSGKLAEMPPDTHPVIGHARQVAACIFRRQRDINTMPRRTFYVVG